MEHPSDLLIAGVSFTKEPARKINVSVSDDDSEQEIKDRKTKGSINMFLYLKDVLFELRARLKLEGYKEGLLYAVKKAFSKIFYLNKYIIFCKNLDELIPSDIRVNDIFFELLNPKHLKLIERDFGPLTRKRFQKRIQTGRTGHICQLNNKIIYHGWIEYETNPMVQLKPYEASLFDVYTVKEFRNRGIQTAMLIKRLEAMKSKGIRRAFCSIEIDNIPSQKVVADKLGFKSMGAVWRGKIIGKSFLYPKKYSME